MIFKDFFVVRFNLLDDVIERFRVENIKSYVECE